MWRWWTRASRAGVLHSSRRHVPGNLNRSVAWGCAMHSELWQICVKLKRSGMPRRPGYRGESLNLRDSGVHGSGSRVVTQWLLPVVHSSFPQWFFPMVMSGCESWTIKKAGRQRINAFELWCWRRLLRVPWTAKEIQPVHPKGNQSWIFIGSTDAEAETPILWPPDAKSRLIGKHPDAGKDWRREEKEATADEMAGWHHWCNGHEFE